jgi:hypothetical protein
MSRACLVKRRRPKKQIHGAQILQPKLSPLERHDPSSDICQSVHSISICLSCTIPLLHHRVSLLEAALSTHPNLQHVRSYVRTDSYMKVFASLTLQDVVNSSLPFTSAPARVIKAHRFNLLDYQKACV